MFDKVWDKIKILAGIIFILGIIASVIMVLAAIDSDYVEGLYIALAVFTSSMILSWLIYGFAVLIENSDKNLRVNERILDLLLKNGQSNDTKSSNMMMDNMEQLFNQGLISTDVFNELKSDSHDK